MNKQIEPLTKEQIPQIVEIIEAVYQEYGFVFDATTETPDLLDFTVYTPPQGKFFGGSVDGQLVATVGVKQIDPETAEIARLYVLAEFRGQGLGQQLLKHADKWARGHNLKWIVLWSDTRFADAHKLYQRAGFVQAGQRTLDDPNNSTEYQFVASLG